MRLRQLTWLGLFATLVFTSAGCQRWRDRNANLNRSNDPLYQRRDAFDAPPPGYPNDPRFGAEAGVGVGAPGGPEVLTPQPYPGEVNPPANPNGMPPTSSGYGGVIPASPPMASRSTSEPPLAKANPFNPPEKQLPRLLPPDLRDPNPAKPAAIPPLGDVEQSPNPPTIDAFAEPKPRVATGRRPDTEGLDWLQANKYRTVLHLRRPGSNDSADREQVNKRGVKYLSLEVSPEGLTRELAEEFSKIVANPANHPLFVYDKDGIAAGAMWYLHFRMADKMPDAMARSKAELYGLKVKGDDEQTAYWAAIQLLIKDE